MGDRSMKLVCFDCNHDYSSEPFQYHCQCGGLFEIVHDFKYADSEFLRRSFEKRLSERMTVFASGVWRYKELIYPELPEEFIVTKYEGNTGLYSSESLQAYTGVRHLWLKAQSENPSGS